MSKKEVKSGKQSFSLEKKSGVWLLLGLTFLVYLKVIRFDLLNFDDIAYITENPLLHPFSFKSVIKIFSEPYYGGYYPLTLLSFGIDLMIGGKNPAAWSHFVNIILHLVNCWLVYRLFVVLKAKPVTALVVTALFALHPMHTESVAWVSERKDVLYTLFYLWSLIAYIRYLEKNSVFDYILSCCLFLFSMLSKTMAAPLVFVLFLVDFYRNRSFRLGRLWLEKIPFFILAVSGAILSYLAQKQSGMITGDDSFTFLEKAILSAFAFCLYIFKLLFPFRLSAYYPYPETVQIFHWTGLLVVAGMVYLLVKNWRKKWFVTGILFFAVNLAMVLQIVQFNRFLIADRFTYVSSIGLFWAGVEWIQNYLENKIPRIRKNIRYGLTGYLFLLVLLAFVRLDVWKDSESIWTDMIEKYPGQIPKAYYFRAYTYLEKNDLVSAEKDFKQVLQYGKGSYVPMAHQSLATMYANMGRFELAIHEMNNALAMDSLNSDYYVLRGRLYLDLEKLQLALKDFNHAIVLNPDNPAAYIYRAIFYTRIKKYREALEDYEVLIRLKPGEGEVYYNRGVIYWQMGDREKACLDWKKANALNYSLAATMLEQYCQP